MIAITKSSLEPDLLSRSRSDNINNQPRRNFLETIFFLFFTSEAEAYTGLKRKGNVKKITSGTFDPNTHPTHQHPPTQHSKAKHFWLGKFRKRWRRNKMKHGAEPIRPTHNFRCASIYTLVSNAVGHFNMWQNYSLVEQPVDILIKKLTKLSIIDININSWSKYQIWQKYQIWPKF